MSESSLSTRWWNQTRLQRATEKTYLSQLAAAQVQPNLKMRIAGPDNDFFGERGGTRTLDPMIKSHVLYRLSYALTCRAV
jgi:hypothetical protein